jgi:D-sedoheptulose 7-phosphate isomerase
MSSNPEMENMFGKALHDHLDIVRRMEANVPLLAVIAQAMTTALRGGGKILWCGNGGSAADSQHLSAELVGRFRRHRRGLASIALTTDSPTMTSVANDYGFEAVFARQVEGLANSGDVLMAISTSGNSPNVIAALRTARAQGLITVAFTGQGGGKSAPLADYVFSVDSKDTARIQEAHMLAGHMLCDWIELDSVTAEAGASPEVEIKTEAAK